MSFPSQQLRRRIWVSIAIFAVSSICSFAYVVHRHKQVVQLLKAGQLTEVRVLLNGYHNWSVLLWMIEKSRDEKLVQAAFDVQFKCWYSEKEDTNFWYPERADVIRRLLADGAKPGYEHLVLATEEDKMQIARLLLKAGVPVHIAGAKETPLANAAYWGDLDLVKDLLQRGAEINEPSEHGWRPVLAAAWSRQTNCVAYLLDHGADVSLAYEEWANHSQLIWKVIEDRATSGADYQAVLSLVREYQKSIKVQ